MKHRFFQSDWEHFTEATQSTAPRSQLSNLLRVESGGVYWTRGFRQGSMGVPETLPECREHQRLRVLFRQAQGDEITELEPAHSAGEGRLWCPLGHDVPWFTTAKTFRSAQVIADKLLKGEVARREGRP